MLHFPAINFASTNWLDVNPIVRSALQCVLSLASFKILLQLNWATQSHTKQDTHNQYQQPPGDTRNHTNGTEAEPHINGWQHSRNIINDKFDEIIMIYLPNCSSVQMCINMHVHIYIYANTYIQRSI